MKDLLVYHCKVPLQRHEEVRLPRIPKPIYVPGQEKGLLQSLGEISRLPLLGLPKRRIPRNGSAIQFQLRGPGMLPPSNRSLIPTVY